MFAVAFCLAGNVRAQEAAPNAAIEAPKFDIFEFVVTDNTVLSAVEIERAVYPYLGPGRTIADVQKAASALEEVYHAAGYLTVAVDVPEQKLENATVKLQVIEGRVGSLKVTGARYYSQGEIRAGVPELAPGAVPNFTALQGELAKLSSTPDRRLTPVLRAGEAPGTVEAELRVEDELPLHGSLEVNDRYIRNTPRDRVAANVRYDNLWQRGHSLSLSGQTAPADPGQTSVLAANYLMPLPGTRALLNFSATKSNSNVAAVGSTDVVGAGSVLGMRAVIPVSGPENFAQSFSIGADYKSYRETVKAQGADVSGSPIRYLPFAANYSLNRFGAGSTDAFSATLNWAIRAGINDEEAFENKRYGAHADYMYLRLNLQHVEQLGGWGSLALRAESQFASGPLISNEQYGIGGVDTVRGYLEFDAAGDQGYAGGLELRSPLWSLGAGVELGVHAFVEGGHVVTFSPLPGQLSHSSMASHGLGMSARGPYGLNGYLDLAQPHIPDQQGQRSLRVHFRLAGDF